ncbi:MAG: hypothetical protein HY902_21255 [Deltaproteobacteria bacterium]|nr:hypothetical protein [Deltaproteobacteria bacterium]
MAAWLGRLLTLATSPRTALWSALLLALPTLATGWLVDDYMHAAAALGRLPGHPGGVELFDFADGHPVRWQFMVGHGLPWWTAPDLSLRFWRPLSSALLWLGYRATFDQPWLLHAVGVALYVATVAAAARLLARALGPRLGALAALIYAVDDGHAMSVTWVANHNALVSSAFALWGVEFWLLWREQRWRPGAPLAVLAWLFGLAGGETALGALALPLAYEFLGGAQPASSSRRERAVRVAALAAPIAVWLLLYKLGGYGARGSGAYLDPLGETRAFVAQSLVRLPALLGGGLVRLPVEIAVAVPSAVVPLALLGAAVASGFAWLLRAAWLRVCSDERRHLAWLWLGSLAALVPACATFAAGRLLLVPSLGMAAAVALAAAEAWPRLAETVQRAHGPSEVAGLRWLALTALGIHLLVSPLAFAVTANGLSVLGRRFDRAVAAPAMAAAGGKVAIVPLSPDLLVAWMPVSRLARGQPAPALWLPLCMAYTDVRVRAVDSDTLRLETLQAPMLATEAERLVRAASRPLQEGQVIDLGGAQVTVATLDRAGQPTAIELHLPRPLADPEHVWLQVDGDQIVPLQVDFSGRWQVLRRQPGILGF